MQSLETYINCARIAQNSARNSARITVVPALTEAFICSFLGASNLNPFWKIPDMMCFVRAVTVTTKMTYLHWSEPNVGGDRPPHNCTWCHLTRKQWQLHWYQNRIMWFVCIYLFFCIYLNNGTFCAFTYFFRTSRLCPSFFLCPMMRQGDQWWLNHLLLSRGHFPCLSISDGGSLAVARPFVTLAVYLLENLCIYIDSKCFIPTIFAWIQCERICAADKNVHVMPWWLRVQLNTSHLVSPLLS